MCEAGARSPRRWTADSLPVRRMLGVQGPSVSDTTGHYRSVQEQRARLGEARSGILPGQGLDRAM